MKQPESTPPLNQINFSRREFIVGAAASLTQLETEANIVPDRIGTVALIENYESGPLSRSGDFRICKAMRDTMSTVSVTGNEIGISFVIGGQRKYVIIKPFNNNQMENIRGKKLQIQGETYILSTLDPVKRDLGVANRFEITAKGEGVAVHNSIVYAVKRAPFRNGKYVEPVTYTPPNPNFVKKENIDAGRRYLEFVTDEAAKLISSLLGKSPKSNTKLLKNLGLSLPFLKAIVQKLMVVEHIDSGSFRNQEFGDKRYTSRTFEQLSQETYTEYALNGHNAYSYIPLLSH